MSDGSDGNGEPYPDWDADFRDQKAELQMELGELTGDYHPAVVLDVLRDELSRRTERYARQWFAQDQEDTDE